MLPDDFAFLCADLVASGESRLAVWAASVISKSWEVWPLERVDPAIGCAVGLRHCKVSLYCRNTVCLECKFVVENSLYVGI